MPDLPQPQPQPPVIQRSFTLVVDMDEEVFYANQPLFKDRIIQYTPFHEPRKNWEINFITKDGKPDFPNVRPKVHITDCYHKKDDKGERLFSVEVERDKITFVLRRTKEFHLFSNLKEEITKCLPIFLETFGSPKISILGLDYANLISKATTPDFIDANGSVMIGQLLTVFNQFPGTFEALMPPYDCKIGLALDIPNRYFSTIQVRGIPHDIAGGSAIAVELNARREIKPRALEEQEVLEILDVLHEFISDSFTNVFTDHAKASFCK